MKMEIDTREFQRALLKYIPTTKKDLAQICNERALNIAFHAIRFQKSARKNRISRELLKPANEEGAPLAALIINKSEGQKGKPGLYGTDMSDAIGRVITARERRRGYLKAGWLAVARNLASKIGKTLRRKPSGVDVWEAEGSSVKARVSFTPFAKIINAVPGIAKVGKPGLQRAINHEAARLMRHVERKLKGSARKQGIRVR